MSPRRFLVSLVAAIAALTGIPARAQEVLALAWPTRHAAPPPSSSSEGAAYLPLLRAAAARLPESAVVSLALGQSSALGLASSDAGKLNDLVSRRYALIAASPIFKTVPSSLNYCLSESRPARGLALLYRPRETNARTPVLLFLHGYGGSFLWYQHQLAEWFPDHLILCPAYGIDPSDISSAYLDEALAAAAARLKHPLAKPTLVGLSAGGFGATRLYAANPAPYAQLIVMAAYPPDESYKAWPKTARSAWLVGALEYYVKDGGFATYSQSLASRSARYQSVIIPKAGHFFLLTHPAETRKALATWLAQP